jgi:hypothetical protein
VVSQQLGNASARLLPCDDFPRAVEGGSRAGRDGPFFTAGCPAVWFTPSEACDFLQGLNKLILFVGDSIARQVQQGLFTALTGSYTHGGVPKFSFPDAEVCRCDDAYKFPCREKTFANYMGPGHCACPLPNPPRARGAAGPFARAYTVHPHTPHPPQWCAQSGWKRALSAR